MEPTEVIDADRQASARPGGWRAHALWAGSVLGIFGLYLTWLSQTELPDGQCSGIGWGCSLAGWDAVGIAAVIYGVPVAFIWLVGHLAIALTRLATRPRRGSRMMKGVSPRFQPDCEPSTSICQPARTAEVAPTGRASAHLKRQPIWVVCDGSTCITTRSSPGWWNG